MAAIMPLLSGIANGARQGILFKSGTHLETIGRVRAIVWTPAPLQANCKLLKTLAVAANLKIESFKSLLLWKFF